jgi:glycosyltransferase involved in cell wall biosynthesis
MHLSVIICTHNPRKQVLERVLVALKEQTLGAPLWELCVIDNASETRLSDHLDLSWHPKAKVVREEEAGLTRARLRGFQETQGSLVVMVDDDNILDRQYLQCAVDIAEKRESIGAFGGSIVGDFEAAVPTWFSQFEYDLIGIRPIDSDRWSNLPLLWETSPIGAGMIVRREVCNAYADAIAKDDRRADLDRRGRSLVSGGDSDIVATACALNFGVGRFVDLKLTHVIPASRLTEEFLSELANAIGYSQAILEGLHGIGSNNSIGRVHRALQFAMSRYSAIRMNPQRRRIQSAFVMGKKRGRAASVNSGKIGN